MTRRAGLMVGSARMRRAFRLKAEDLAAAGPAQKLAAAVLWLERCGEPIEAREALLRLHAGALAPPEREAGR